MRKIFFLFIALFATSLLSAQTAVIFHEDFELPSSGDSVTSSSDPTGAAPWAISTKLSNKGLRSDSTVVQPGANTYLTTNSFSTLGYSKVFLKFAQICKVLFQDGGSIQYSTDGGSNWQIISSTYYRGNGILALDKFSENSYTTYWMPGDTLTTPNNTWWRAEKFDLSTLIANQANVQIRFRLTDGSIQGGQGRYGWLLDDIQVLASNNELDEPVITYKNPIYKDTVYVTGPFNIKAYIKDSSTVTTVNLTYNINGGSDVTIPMINVSDSTYSAEIPSQTYNNVVCYKILASDFYNNTSTLPSGTCQQFMVLKGSPTVQIGNTTTSGYNSPIYIASATSTYLYSYNAMLFKKSEIMAGGTIQSIAFNKADVQGYNLSNATLRIYMKSVPEDYTPNTYTDYLNSKNGAIKVYENTSQNINTASGWQNFNFNSSLFNYSGSENLMIFVEWYRPNNATGAVNFYYNTVPNQSGMFYGASQIPSLSVTTGQRANIKINFQTSTENYDATVAGFDSPTSQITANTTIPVAVRVKNLGLINLTKANVKWSVDGVYQGSVNWTGNLPQDFVGSSINLGNINLALGPHKIKAWTELPNDSIDQNSSNDTSIYNVYACQDLNGTYTVGTSTANFPTFTDLFNALNNCGINGDVTFKIKNGVYNTQLYIPAIANASSTNTITFESESGNKNDVIIQYDASNTTNNYVIKLEGASYLKFKNITVKALNGTYGKAFELTGGSKNNTIEGCKIDLPLSTASTVVGINNTSGTILDNYNTIFNNEITGGYYGIYMYGSSTTVKEVGNIISGNIIKDFYYYGIYSYYQDSIIINSNRVYNSLNSTAYGLYAYYNDNGNYLNNKIGMNALTTNYCMYFSNNNNTAGKSLIANNFISQAVGTGTVYGIYSSTNKNMNIYNNSVNVTKGSLTGGYSIYITGGSALKIKNNNFINTGGGYAYYANTVTAIDSTNYNNIYSNGINLAYWNGAKTDLSSLQSSSSQDYNSISVNPQFLSTYDLHVLNFFLNGKGESIVDITTDIDGDLRADPPCIGADEFIVPNNDAGITMINAPANMITTLSQNIKVTIKNMGLQPLVSADINYSINGVVMPSYSWTGNLVQNDVDSIVIATNYTFNYGISKLKVWTSNPNNVADIFPLNDTVSKTVYGCAGALSGNYSLGAAGSDYQTFNDALVALQNCGISGPTTFLVEAGTYFEQFTIGAIPGSSAINTVTFKSSDNDSTSVILDIPANSTISSLIKIDAAQNIIIKGMTLKNTTSSGKVIEITNAAKNIEISNNIINASLNSTSTGSSAIYSYNTLEEKIKINNNVISGGYNGVYLYGIGTTSKEKNHEINNNVIKDFYYYGLYIYYMDSIKVIGNTINSRNTSTTVYGIYAYYNDNGIFSNNKVNVFGTSTNYGMYIYYNNSSAGNSRVYNNMVTQHTGTSTNYGIAAYYGQNVDYNFNSVQLNAGGTSGYAFYAPGGTNISLRNSALSNLGGGYALYTSGSSTIVASDYNNLYSTGTNLAYWGSIATNLTALQALSGKDINSISTNPSFFSSTDLHTDNTLMFRKGLKISYIPMDIDGQVRDTLKPCIGADEYIIVPNDASVKALYTLGKLPIASGSPHKVNALIENKGSNTLYNLNVNLSISGANSFTNTHIIDSIPSGRIDTITFANFTPTSLGDNNVKISVPNDDLSANNEKNYLQKITDTVFAYADTSGVTTSLGFNAGQGLFLTKYYMNGAKMIPSLSAYITNSNTIGQKLYGVILNSNGVLIDTSFSKVITASDTNSWVKFNFANPPFTTTANDYFYIGFAQLTGTTGGYYPLGCQAEVPARRGSFYYTTNLTGGTLTETTQFGRFMIEANTGNPPPFDASLTSVIEPTTGCNMVGKQVKIEITNMGSDTIIGATNLIAKYALNLNGNLINVVSEPLNVNILPSANYIYTFNTLLTLPANTADSNYYFYSWVELSGDAFKGNDTAKVTIISRFTPQAPIAVTPVSIIYAAQANLSATSTSPMFWYNNINNNTSLGQGPSFTTPNLFATDTFYVTANTSVQSQAIIGTGTAVNTTTGFPAPYGNYYWGAKHQILVTKAELNSFGITGGPITSLAFDVATVQGTALQNFEIKAGHTPLSVMATGAWVTNTVPVYSTTAYTEVLGWNTHNFSTPFIWNGIDNVVFEVCFNNSSYTYNALTRYTPTTANSVAWRNSDAADICTTTPATTASVNRPNMKIQGNVPGCNSISTPVVVIVTNIPAVDAGIDQITSPTATISSNINTPVTVIIKNYGTSHLTSATIGWSIDGVSQNPVPWTGNITGGQLSAPFQLANIPFAGGLHEIKAWTFNPNGSIDMYAINDTAYNSFAACMTGLFTIGTTGNYPGFNAAMQAVNSSGVCGNVIFDVLPGTYDEQLIINQVSGVGPNSTITFRSQNSNSASVILTYTGTSTSNAVLKLNGTDYFRFENITIKSSGATITRAVEIGNGANNNIFTGNKIETDVSTTSTYCPIYSTSTGKDRNNEFSNNRISGGYYGIYWYGSSTNMKYNTKFTGNTVIDFYYYGIYLYYTDSSTVESNSVHNSGTSTASYGIYLSYNNNVQKITKNKVHLKATSSNYCMYLSSNSNLATQPALVANNFISQEAGSGTVYGIYNSSTNNYNYYNNSINITSGSPTSTYGIYAPSGSGLNVINNISANLAGGYAYYVTTPASIILSNNNDFYTTGSTLAYYSKACANLDSLRLVSGKDSASISINPNYSAISNLHIINFDLDGKAIPLAQVTDDIDGDLRNVNIPDIGADEFVLPANDAGVLTISDPSSPSNPGINMVKAVIKNYGTSNLTSANINWQVNGVNQTPYNWTGNLPMGGVDTASIGTYNFIQGASTIKSWTRLPNGVTDQLNVNDTNLSSVVICSGPLSGTYIIGGTSATYQTINQAILSLKYCGVGGPVVFNINQGNYNEQLLFTPVTGASSINTITFKSASDDSSSVIINYEPTANNNYILKLDGADYLKFKYLSFINNTQTTNGRVIELINGSNYNEFSNNVVRTIVSTSSTTAGFYSGNTSVNNRNMIRNNVIENGYYGIYWYGSSTYAKFGNTFENNSIKGFYYYGIYNYYSDSVTIKGNFIKSSPTSGYAYGIYSYYAYNGCIIEKNKVEMPTGTTLYPIYMSYCSGSSTKRNLVANNFISQTGGTTTYGLYIYYSDYVDVIHNSINILAGGTTSRAFYISAGSGNTGLRLYNNSFVNAAGGPAVEVTTGAQGANYISAMNYNNLWSTGTILGKWGATSCNTLSQWITACAKDSASISVNPDYLSTTDLHVYSVALNDKGTPIANVTTDIDGDIRNISTPDIGADEFTPLPNDIGVVGIYSPDVYYGPVASTVTIKCIIKNYGSVDATNFNISYKIGNAAAINYLYTDTLFANAFDSIVFPTPMTVTAGNVDIKSYTSLVNDGKFINDTSMITYFGVPVKGIPYSENFDGTTDEWFKTGGTMQWQNGIPNASVINNAHSAPNVWTTVLNGNYANGSNDYLYSPIFNNSTFKADTLKFWFYMDAENNKDGGRIEYKNQQGDWLVLGNPATIDTNSVNWYNASSVAMWTGTGQGWQEAKYAVSKILNNLQTLQFRFVFNSDGTNNNYNGWAIDDFNLSLLPIAQDGGVVAITDPSASLLGDTVYPKITVKNFGLNPLTSIPVKYTVNGQLMASETINTTLAPGSTVDYTFTQYFKVLTQPTYTIKAFTTIAGDYYNGADTSIKVINVSPALKDVGIVRIIAPADAVSSGSSISVSITIRNYGSIPVTSVPVAYQRGTQPVVNEIWTGSALNIGDSAIFTFPTAFTVPLGSSFAFSAFTNLSGDAYPINNKITKSISITSMPANAGSITSTAPNGGSSVCFPIGSTTPIIVTYSVPTISNATNYVWNYTGTNVTFSDTTTTNSVAITFDPSATDGSLTVYGYNTLGTGGTSPAFAIDIIPNCTVGIDEEMTDIFWMNQNMPNPANGITSIEYNLPQQGSIAFEIVNMVGQSVYNFKENKTSGKHSINLNAKELPDGIYYYSLTYNGKRLVKKMIINN